METGRVPLKILCFSIEIFDFGTSDLGVPPDREMIFRLKTSLKGGKGR